MLLSGILLTASTMVIPTAYTNVYAADNVVAEEDILESEDNQAPEDVEYIGEEESEQDSDKDETVSKEEDELYTDEEAKTNKEEESENIPQMLNYEKTQDNTEIQVQAEFEEQNEEKDTEPPVIHCDTLTIDKIEAKVGDTIKFSVRVTDNNELKRVVIGFENPDNNQIIRWPQMEYNPDTDKYEYDLFIDKEFPAGKWRISSVLAYDVDDNNDVEIYNANHDANGMWDFTVDNLNIDSEAPVISRETCSIDKTKVVRGDIIKFSVKVTDNVAVNHLELVLENKDTGDELRYNIDGKDEDYYEYEIKIDDQFSYGHWYVSFIYAYDDRDNYSCEVYMTYHDDLHWFIVSEDETGLDYDCEVENLKLESGTSHEFGFSYDSGTNYRIRIIDSSIVGTVKTGKKISSSGGVTTITDTYVFLPYDEGSTVVEVTDIYGNVYKAYKITVTPGKYTGHVEENVSVTFISTTDQTYTAYINDTKFDMKLTGHSSATINGKGQHKYTYALNFSEAGNNKVYIIGNTDNKKIVLNIDIKDHTWSEKYTIDKEATCTEEGSQSIHCTKCDVVQDGSKKSIPRKDHTWDNGKTTTEETCTEGGEKVYTCTVCSKTKTEKIEATGHAWSAQYTVDKKATCTEKGQQSKHCVACNAVDESSIEDIAPMGHKWSDKYTIDKEATCTNDGQKSIHCEVCDAINKDSIEEIKSTGHTWDKGKVTKEPTCTENGEKVYTCECGETKKENIKATGHKWNDKYTTDKAATCTENGSESIHCTICKVVKKDSEKVISKTGHNYSEWIVVNEPTDSKEGLEKKTCKNCGDEITQKIPKLVGQWMSDSRGYWYKYPNGEHSKPDWGKIDGYWYYFDANGYRMTGWQHIRGNWYYLANDGKMAADTWIGSYYVNASGEWVKTAQPAQWIKSGNLWWYRHTDGSYTKNGWETINGKKYHFDNVGWMQTDWQKIDGNWYYFGGANDGAMKTGWQRVNGTWYYMYSDGKMAANTWVGNYWVDGSGAWTKTKQPAQWVLSGNRWWYRHEDGGYTTNGFETIGGKIYYFDGAGWMVTGWRNVNNKWYYFDGSGAMKTKAWIGDYYVGSNGVMATNAWIGNYYVGNDGKWVPGNNR